MHYAGITVGPIIDTLGYTATPAGLWCASYFFSTLVRDLCEGLRGKGYDILTLPEDYDMQQSDHGIGTYHDRIYYKSEKEKAVIRQEWNEIYEEVLQKHSGRIETALREAPEASHSFDRDKIGRFLKDYLQVHSVILTEEQVRAKGIAASLAKVLDAVELAGKVVTKQESNPLRRLIRGDKDNSNRYVKKYPALQQAAVDEEFPLAEMKDESVDIRSIGEIGSGSGIGDIKRTGKTAKYFAIVQCDGDSMGKTIASEKELDDLEKQENRLREFSRMCMRYTKDASRLVVEYGGVVIYAGGDDLLFLAPILSTRRGSESGNVWELCRSVGQKFDEIFREADTEKRPSLSIGMSIHYQKFPLYEAFEDAIDLLFGTAKKFNPERKNNLAIRLHKHSGQSVDVVCCMETNASIKERCGLYDEFLKFLKDFNDSQQKNSDQEKNLFMHSMLYHLENQHILFRKGLLEEDGFMLSNAFQNVFDHPNQEFGGSMRDGIISLMEKAKAACRGEDKLAQGSSAIRGKKEALSTEEANAEAIMAVVSAMLRISKFLVEEA